MRLLFLINGTEASAAAVRARSFGERLPSNWTIGYAWRPRGKTRGVAEFLMRAARFRPDVLYVMDWAYTGVVAGWLARGTLGCRVVTDTGDAIYSLALARGGHSSTQLRMIRWVEHLASRKANAVVVRGSFHREILLKAGAQRVEFIPDGVNPEEFRPLQADPLRRSLGLDAAFVLGMVGSMNWSERHAMCYGWDLVEAVALLRHLPVKALLVGDGSGRARLEARARELGIVDRVVFSGNLPYASLPEYINAMDVCVSTQSNNVVGMVRTTGKLPLYLACGKYVVATDVGEASKVLPGIGSLLPYEGVRDEAHPERLSDEVRSLREWHARTRVAEPARKVARENFDYGVLTSRARELCESLCSSS